MICSRDSRLVSLYRGDGKYATAYILRQLIGYLDADRDLEVAVKSFS